MVRYTTVDDVGVAVNPMLVTGQVHGGVAQGIGQALYEGVAYSEEGQLLTATYQDYCVPRAADVPPIAVTLDDSAPCKTNPLGAKGCGEFGAIGGPPCVTNGVMDALSELGIVELNTPLTPVKVWQAIQDAKARVNPVVFPGRCAASSFRCASHTGNLEILRCALAHLRFAFCASRNNGTIATLLQKSARRWLAQNRRITPNGTH